MATKAQIAEQVQLERDQIAQGLKRLRDNTRQLEERDYASASIYGVVGVDTLLPLLVARIKDTANRIHEGRTGQLFAEIAQYLADIEPEVAAAIACKLTFDKVFGAREDSHYLVNVTAAIGRALEDECQMRHYEREAPGLLKVLKDNYWHRSIGTQQKVTVIQTLMNRHEIDPWKTWGQAIRIKLGGWLLDCIIEVSGWFTKYAQRSGRKTTNVVVATPAFMQIKDEVMANAEIFSPLAWPMLIEPNNWEPHRAGGYVLNEVMKGHDMVRRGDPTLIQGETIYKFLNHIQKVGYKLNPFIVDVAETLWARGMEMKSFIPIVNHELPPKPVDIAENKDSRKDYRRRAAEVMNRNAASFKKSCRTRMTMEAVKVFKNKSFYLPWSLDYRGRAYPIPSFLTPHDTDFGKSLLMFDEPAFMTHDAEGWLKFQVATTYGLDKSPMAERLQWAEDNEKLIEQIATDPLGMISEWEVADEPWQFLAACREYYEVMIACTKQSTCLMVATDATCSGIQVLAGLARDASAGALTNVLPSDRPQDAYKVIAESAKPFITTPVKELIDRKVTKRTVMTVPYNSKPFSNRSYIKEALKEKGYEIEKEELTELVNQVRAAMYRELPGPMRVMDWIEEQVSVALADGRNELTWTTPSGFSVTQKLMKKEIQKIELQLMGRCVINVASDSQEVDRQHHKNATSPNLIHSLDASLLHLSAIRFNAPLALIHDSVLCRATDMACLSAIVRETYMHLFAEHDYLNDWSEQIGATTNPPIVGDLKPESVIESTYFFC